MHLIKLFYQISYLEAREHAGMRLSSAERERLSSLRELLTDDPGWRRRRYRRLSVKKDGVVRNGSEIGGCAVLNMSAGGALIATCLLLREGDQLQLKVERARAEAEYTFPCRVRRVRSINRHWSTAALSFDGIPLEIRHGRRTPIELPISELQAVG